MRKLKARTINEGGAVKYSNLNVFLFFCSRPTLKTKRIAFNKLSFFAFSAKNRKKIFNK